MSHCNSPVIPQKFTVDILFFLLGGKPNFASTEIYLQ